MTKALVLLVVSLLSSGCDLTQPQSVTAVAVAKPAPAKPIVRLDQLEFSDLSMQKSSKFSINGDQRPFYLVAGRIQNHSPYATVTSVRLFIGVWGTDGKQDSAVLNLKTDILPGQTQSFKQECQLLPPPGKWNWQYEALSVEAENN